MVFRLGLTYYKIIEILDVKNIAGSTEGNTLAADIYEATDINMMLKSLFPKYLRVKSTIDDIRLKSNLTVSKTLRFTKKYFFYTALGFTQSHVGVLGDIPGFVQLIPGSYKSDKPMNIAGIDKVHIKAD